MNWVALITNIFNHVPFERALFPPRDNTKALEEFITSVKQTKSSQEAPVSEKPTSTITRPSLQLERPTTGETTTQLKRRLAKELYKVELDLANGLRIAGKPCDCLDAKHSLFIEAVAEEMISLDPGNPVYHEILVWLETALPKGTFEAISSGQYDAEYPLMASQMRDFRKRLTGSTSRLAMTEPKKQSTKGNCPICGGLLDKDGCCPVCKSCPLPKPT